MSDYRPQKGDRVRVVIEDTVIAPPDDEGTFETVNNWFEGTEGHVVSVEKIEPGAVLPDGLTISEDGSLLNWLGENYVRQPAEKTVEVFKPGDVVRQKDEHYFANSEFASGTTYNESPSGIGSIGRIRDNYETSRGPEEHVAVRWEGGKTSIIATRSLELVDFG